MLHREELVYLYKQVQAGGEGIAHPTKNIFFVVIIIVFNHLQTKKICQHKSVSGLVGGGIFIFSSRGKRFYLSHLLTL